MDMHTIRRKNLRDIITNYGDGSVAGFARKYGFTEARLSQLLSTTFRAGQNFGEKMARKIEYECELPTLALDRLPDDLAGLKAEQYVHPLLASGRAMDAMGKRIALSNMPAFIEVPVVRLQAESGASGYSATQEMDGAQPVRIGAQMSWVRKNDLSPKQLLGIAMSDDSMTPSIYAGDTLIINTDDTEPVDGAVFALNYEGAIVIRRVLRDAGEWWLVSDNPDQRRFGKKILHPGSVQIIGKVILKESKYI